MRSVQEVVRAKSSGTPFVMVTAYDANSAAIASDAGVDLLLVGDSLAMTSLGFDDTLHVDVDEMLQHVASVARAMPATLIVADMPWLSYHLGPEAAVLNASRLIRAGAGAVKLEGGRKRLPVVRAILDAEIPVMGHLGLTPQSVRAFGGFTVQGREPEQAEMLLEDADALAGAGCFALVLEAIPATLAASITGAVPVPTIGIGAGPDCDGQVLVFHDLLGLQETIRPRFVRRYAALRPIAVDAIRRFARDVRSGEFPSAAESYGVASPASPAAKAGALATGNMTKGATGVADGAARAPGGGEHASFKGRKTRARLFRFLEEYVAAVRADERAGQTIGLVPTMGALHAGHLSLVGRAAEECDVVVVSVFVNPRQFEHSGDLERYPRDLETDLELATQAGARYVLAPEVKEMYPAGFETSVHVAGLSDRLEGRSRPGHFDGVTTVVAKLLSLTGHCHAYFGEKDFQQLVLVRQMAADLDLPVEIVGCPTVREQDGLACSTRNAFLSPSERAAATALYRGLLAGASRARSKTASVEDILAAISAPIDAEPLCALDYAEVVDPETLDRPVDLAGELRLLVAAHLGRTRLIDNVGVAMALDAFE